jgi:hypothetical protein
VKEKAFCRGVSEMGFYIQGSEALSGSRESSLEQLMNSSVRLF